MLKDEKDAKSFFKGQEKEKLATKSGGVIGSPISENLKNDLAFSFRFHVTSSEICYTVTKLTKFGAKPTCPTSTFSNLTFYNEKQLEGFVNLFFSGKGLF